MINTIKTNPYLVMPVPEKKPPKDKQITLQKQMNNEPNFTGSLAPNSATMQKFYKSERLHKFLNFANNRQLLFGASFALFLTCILRPASIMVAPSKKNKDDQKYASAHSIASGVIGFAISTVLFYPLENAIKKLTENPKYYIEENKELLKFAKEKNNKYVFKEVPATYLGRLGDLAGSIPKGILTIALIPPILKYVFGWEKKKPTEKSVQPQQIEQFTKGGLK